MLNSEKRDAMWFSLCWDRGTPWVARGGYADDCALQGLLLPLSTSIYEKQHDALTLGQNEANGSYSHYFPRVALENKQVNTQRELSSHLSLHPAIRENLRMENGLSWN